MLKIYNVGNFNHIVAIHTVNSLADLPVYPHHLPESKKHLDWTCLPTFKIPAKRHQAIWMN